MVKEKRHKNDTPLVQKYLKKYRFLKGYFSAFNILSTTMLRFPDMSNEKEQGKAALSSDWHAVGGDLYKAINGNTTTPSHHGTAS